MKIIDATKNPQICSFKRINSTFHRDVSVLFYLFIYYAPDCCCPLLPAAAAERQGLASLPEAATSYPPQLATWLRQLFVRTARRPPPHFSTKQALNKPSHFAEPLAQRRVLPFSLVFFLVFFFLFPFQRSIASDALAQRE